MSLDEVVGLDIVDQRWITHVICICSTFGRGKPPGNAVQFFNSHIVPSARGTKFAVLALGSSLYPDFCRAGSNLDVLLEKSGLEQLVPLTKVDNVSGPQKTISN